MRLPSVIRLAKANKKWRRMVNICDGIFYSENKSTLIHFAYTECKWNGLATLNLADSEKVTKIANQACANSSIQRLVLGKKHFDNRRKIFFKLQRTENHKIC